MFDKSFAKTPSLKIRGVNTYAVEVPMTFPLGTSAAIVKKAPLLLVDINCFDSHLQRTVIPALAHNGQARTRKATTAIPRME